MLEKLNWPMIVSRTQGDFMTKEEAIQHVQKNKYLGTKRQYFLVTVN